MFGQWLHLYETDESLVLSVLAAINAVFASYEIFITNGGDMLIVASPAERMPAADWSIFDSAALQEDFCHTLPITTAALEAMRVTHSSALAPILDDWESPNSDYYPVVDLRAERTRYLRTTAAGFISLTVGRFDFSAPFFGRRSLPGVEPPVAMSAVPRASALALGTALRAHREASPDDSADVDYPAPAVRRRHAQWRATLASDEQADWKLWLDEFRAIETDLHKGTAGFVDEAFFSSTREYLRRNAAPQVVLDVVSFRHGLDGWDFEEAAIAARALLDAGAHNDGYVPLEEILDGGVTAFLQVGDVQSANRLYAAVQPAVSRSAADLRSRLLRAYLEASN